MPQSDNDLPTATGISQYWLGFMRARHAYGLAILIGLAWALTLFPLSFLAGHGAFFEQGDASQHVTGWRFFADDTWHFPLLKTERLNHPDGTVIAFTDSIPLVALLLKPFAAMLPAGFHYFGLWHAFIMVLQAIGATFLIRSFGLRHKLATLSAIGFALLSPALLWRIGHPSLMAHGLLLIALGLYFRGGAVASARRITLSLIALCAIALLVHPYLLAMCYAVLIAFICDRTIRAKRWRLEGLRFVIPPLLSVLFSIVILAGLGVVLGYFGGSTTTYGFGVYSMNLTAPFCGSRFFTCVTNINRHQFAAFHFADATTGQYEGFNYLGIGLFLMMGCIIAQQSWRLIITIGGMQFDRIKSFCMRYPTLLLILVLCILYALSNRIYFGDIELISYPLPTWTTRLTGTFRASGRFFWPVGYVILFSVLVVVLRQAWVRQHAGISAGLLLTLLAMQAADVQPLIHNIQLKASKPAVNDIAELSTVMNDVDKIFVYPAFGCGNDEPTLYWLFQRVAAQYGKLLNTGYIARLHPDCMKSLHDFTVPFQPRHLYVMPISDLHIPFTIPAGFQVAINHRDCVSWRKAVLCQQSSGRNDKSSLLSKMRGTDAIAVAPRDFGSAEWHAADLPTQIGKLEQQRLIPKSLDQPGYLSYGPYAILPAGRYRLTLRYASNAKATLQAGQWEAVESSGNGEQKKLAAGVLAGSSGVVKTIDANIDIEGFQHPLEIRTIYSGGVDLQLVSITLAPAP
jgi:hypothetical protein